MQRYGVCLLAGLLVLWHARIAPAATGGTSSAGAYRIVDLGLLPGTRRGAPVEATGVNNSGVVVGGCGQKPFRWTAKSGMRPLPLPPGSIGSASAVNDAGWIAGLCDGDACAWTPQGEFIRIGRLPGHKSMRARGVGADGSVYGSARGEKLFSFRPFVWRPGRAIQDAGVAIHDPTAQARFSGAAGTFACGTCTTFATPSFLADRACLWDADRGFQVLAAPAGPGSDTSESEAFGVNAFGDAVGRVSLHPKGSYACLWRADAKELLDLGRLDRGENFVAIAVNGSRDIVGTYNDARGRGRVFIWSERAGMRPVEDLLTKESRRWNIEGASALNDRGAFVGLCSRDGIGYAYLAIPSPGPAAAETRLAPLPGEIQLTGTVRAVSAGRRSLRLSVTAITQPDGTSVTLPAPRPKTILLSGQTRVVTASAAPSSLTTVKAGAVLTVIGPDAGVGKALTARTVILP